MTLRYLIMREVLFKIGTLSKDTREFVATRISLMKPQRIMTFRLDVHRLPPKPKTLKDYWLPGLMSHLNLIITNGVDFNYILWTLKKFKPTIILNIEMENFVDEEVSSEKFMELLGYYSINEIILNKCSFSLKSSASYLIGPAKTIRATNSMVRFNRPEQILACEHLKLESTKLYIANGVECLFANVRRAFMSNVFIKDNWPQMFSSNLKELILKRTVAQTTTFHRLDYVKKMI